MDRKLLLLIVLGVVLYGANFWGVSIYILDEAKNSACAMEMYERGDWVVPTFNGELRADKPPLHYYFMRTGYAMFGVSPFSARLFSVLVGIGLIICVYRFTEEFLGKDVAFVSSLLLVVSIQLCIQFHLAVPDPYLIFFLTLGLLSFYRGYTSGRTVSLYLFYGTVSLATLAKGPVAVVFAGLIVFIYLIFFGKFSLASLGKLRIIHGSLIFLTIVVPWYYMVGVATKGEWLQQFFLEHNVGRFTSTMEGHSGFPLASVVIPLVALLPFSVFAPQAVRRAWVNRREDSFAFFCLIAAGVVVIFFAFSRTILPNYPEPAVPFFAVVIGSLLATKMRECELPESFIWSGWVYLAVSLVLPVAAWFGLRYGKTLSDLSALAAVFIVLSIGGITGLVFLKRKNLRAAIYSYAGSLAVFLLVFFYIVFPQIDKRNPVIESLAQMDPDVPVFYYRRFNPAFVLARKDTLPVIETREEMQRGLDVFGRFYVVTQGRYLHELGGLSLKTVYEGNDLFENTTTVVLEFN